MGATAFQDRILPPNLYLTSCINSSVPLIMYNWELGLRSKATLMSAMAPLIFPRGENTWRKQRNKKYIISQTKDTLKKNYGSKTVMNSCLTGERGGIFYMFTSALLIQPSGLSGLSLIIVEKSWIAASAFSLCWKEIITFLIQNRINFLESNKDVQSWGYSTAQVNTRYINKELTCRPFCT